MSRITGDVRRWKGIRKSSAETCCFSEQAVGFCHHFGGYVTWWLNLKKDFWGPPFGCVHPWFLFCMKAECCPALCIASFFIFLPCFWDHRAREQVTKLGCGKNRWKDWKELMQQGKLSAVRSQFCFSYWRVNHFQMQTVCWNCIKSTEVVSQVP